jgi:hypothetical protein
MIKMHDTSHYKLNILPETLILSVLNLFWVIYDEEESKDIHIYL